MRTLPILLFFLFAPGIVSAQNDFESYRKRRDAAMNDYRRQRTEKMDAYRAKRNREFAEFLKQKWSKFEITPAKPAPVQPAPVTPPVAPVKPVVKPPVEVPVDVVRPQPPVAKPKPIDVPVNPPAISTLRRFTFYGTPCAIHYDKAMDFRLPDTCERSVGDAWQRLSGKVYDALVGDLQDLHKALHLGDWGLLQLAGAVATQVVSGADEATLLQAYLMTQFDYDVRVCRQNGRLALLVPVAEQLCNISYYRMNKHDYYLMGRNTDKSSIETYSRSLADASKVLSMQMTEVPKFSVDNTPVREFGTKQHPEMTCRVSVNRQLMEFYDDLPFVRNWGYYADLPLDRTLVSQLYPVLKASIAGKTQTEAAGLLLHWMQYAFAYKTDGDQFGREKSFMCEENFYYPYNDCEDRAILYSRLVRDLVGLDVVLLIYPGHACTAVRFPSDVKGDYVTVDGNRYVICDPTYIGATIGMCMDNCKKEKAEVVRLRR